MLRNNEIISALQRQGARNACARCGQLQFEVVGETTIDLKHDTFSVGLYSLGALSSATNSSSIAVAIVACSNCGNLSHHALSILGIAQSQPSGALYKAG